MMIAAIMAPTSLPKIAMPNPETSMEVRSRVIMRSDNKNPLKIVGTGTNAGFIISKIGEAINANPIPIAPLQIAPSIIAEYMMSI